MPQHIFSAISALLIFVCAIPYIRDIIRRQTKPRIVSWFNWSILTGIATAAAIADNQWPSAILTGASTIQTGAICVLGFKYGDRKIEAFDVACQVGAVVGLLLWLVFDSPQVAILATVSIDFIAGLPTYKHAWLKPSEETRSTYVLATIAAALALLAITDRAVSGIAYPLFIFFANVLISSELIFSPHRKKLTAE